MDMILTECTCTCTSPKDKLVYIARVKDDSFSIVKTTKGARGLTLTPTVTGRHLQGGRGYIQYFQCFSDSVYANSHVVKSLHDNYQEIYMHYIL